MKVNRLPLIPTDILQKHMVHEAADSRFKAAARMLQSLWRAERDIPVGIHVPANGTPRKLGSRIDKASAKQGANFLTPAIAKLALRESVYREIGAVIEQDRLWTNMLSSQPLCFNLFGELKLNLHKASQFFRHLFPDYVVDVEDIYFEHSPGRGDEIFTADNTAFDVFVICRTVDGVEGFLAIEVKYSESMAEPLATLRPRYAELSQAVGIYREPSSNTLRGSPLQQLWREHMLTRAMVGNGLYETGRFVLIYPQQNHHCDSAARLYLRELISPQPAISGFHALTLEDCLGAFTAIGEEESAKALHSRYLDFGKIDHAIFG